MSILRARVPCVFRSLAMRPSRRIGLVFAMGAVLLALPAEPCSICRCGDPTFNALGKEGYVTKGFRLALDCRL